MPEKKWTDWKETPAMDVYGQPGNRRGVKTPEGKVRRLPRLRYEEWCKPCGSLVRIAIETTRDQRVPGRQAYTDIERRRQVAAGSFPWLYETCQLLTPTYVVGMTEAEWHIERERLLKERRKQHEASVLSIDTGDEQVARAIEGNTAAVTKMIESVVEQMARKTNKQSSGA